MAKSLGNESSEFALGDNDQLIHEARDRAGRLLDSMEALYGVRILLAEDSLFNQEVAVELLNDVGVTVCVASNGKEALELLRKEPFDCVLMDVQMPVMNGLEATRLMRADAALVKMPVIALTANVSDEDRERCFAAGMDDFIAKPFKLASFYATIARLMLVRPQQENIAASPFISETTMAGGAKVIDFAVLANWMGNDNKKMRKLALKFINTTREDIARIEEALERKDMAAVGDLGHRAKSGARMVGAIGFGNLCQALESGMDSMDAEQAQIIVNKLRAQLGLIEEQVKKHLA